MNKVILILEEQVEVVDGNHINVQIAYYFNYGSSS